MQFTLNLLRSGLETEQQDLQPWSRAGGLHPTILPPIEGPPDGSRRKLAGKFMQVPDPRGEEGPGWCRVSGRGVGQCDELDKGWE